MVTYKIDNTETNRQAAAMHDTTRPWVVIADRSWNKIVGRYTTKAGAKAAIKRLQKK